MWKSFHPVSISANQPRQPRHPEQASTRSPVLLLLRRDAYQNVSFSPLLTVVVGPGSQITYTKDTHPYMARDSQVAWRRGFAQLNTRYWTC